MLTILLWSFLISGIIENLQTRTVYIENVSASSVELPLVKVAEDPANKPNSSLQSEEYQEEKSNLSTLEVRDIENLIEKIAKEENFENVEGLKRLAFCESSLGRKTVNYNNDTRKTVDRGIFMINDYWHSEVTDDQAYNNEWSIRWTINRISAGFLEEWNCWKVYNDKNYLYK